MVSILDVPEHNLTPGMRQYRDAKRENPNCLIMLRMGDFYEMFYEDAEIAARDLEITLTKRGKGEKCAPLAGVPYHALEQYLGRLVKKGHKVAIIEQLEDPKKAKGLVKRGLVRIVTAGTLIESSLLESNENNYLLALHCISDNYSYSIADLSTGEFVCGQHSSEDAILAEIQKRSISECIIPTSLLVNQELVAAIKKNNALVNSYDDYYFKSERAKKILEKHFKVNSLEAFGLNSNQTNLISVAGALLSYLQETQKNSLAHFKNLRLVNQSEIMHLDRSTLNNLELLTNLQSSSRASKSKKQISTLLDVLNKTVSPIGSRLLKKLIKEPLLNLEKIEQRLGAIENLNQRVIEREEIRELLKDVYDLERLIGRVNYGNANPKDLISLASTLEKIPLIKQRLQYFDSSLLQEVNTLESVPQVLQLIKSAIKEDAPITIRDGGIIKSEFHEELKSLREIKTNSKQFLQEIEQREKEKIGISNLRISYNRVFGYFIEVTKKNVPLVPENYIRKQTTANSERYITEELKVEEDKILGAEDKIKDLEYDLFLSIISEITKYTTAIQDCAAKLALLDVLCSLSIVSMENNYCRPQFNQNNVINIVNGRHPVVEKKENNFIPNTVQLKDGQMMIITGPNTSGKSTVMRQTALIVLMAQVGSFVPATSANLSIIDRIFTRVGAHDDLSSGQSTFMVEMLETASILHNATDKSLIILDEIGRGTSTFDGVAIAWSTAEHIYNQLKAKAMFATHYHVLNKLASKFENIVNYNVAVKDIDGQIIFLRKLVEGGCDQSHGVHVAKLAGMPESVIERAKEIQKTLEAEDEMVKKIKAKKLIDQASLGDF